MPMLERAVTAASDANTLAAIETIRAALSSAVDPEYFYDDDALHGQAAPAGDDVGPATPTFGPFGHGKIRLHGRS